MRPLVWIVCLGLALSIAPRFASAQSLAVEARHSTQVPGDPSLLTPFFEELSKRSIVRWEGELVVGSGAQWPATARTATGLRSDFVEAVDRDYRLWTAGQFRECTVALQALIDEAHRNPADVSANARVGTAIYKGLVGLSLCHHRLGDAASSRAAMSELLRSFDVEVSKGLFGAEAFELFARVRDEQKASASGALSVRSTDETAAIFINERFAKVGQMSRAGLVPGRYRIFAQVGRHQSRVHLVEVKAGENISVELDPSFERTVITTPEWSGLMFDDREERTRIETSSGARLGAAVSAKTVILVGIDERGGKPWIYGASIDVATRKETRRASVSLERADQTEAIRSLARFLSGEAPAAGVEVEGIPLATKGSVEERSLSSSAWWTGWKWIAAGSAVASVGAGATLLILDGDCTTNPPPGMKCPDLHDYKLGGIMLSGVGVALAVAATWLWLGERSEDDSSTALWATPSHNGMSAGISFPW